MTVCEVCGNERESTGNVCPYCGSRSNAGIRKEKRFLHKVVNLEAGRPVVEVALHKMTEMLEDAQRNKITVVTLIHGYGSSGKGGIIKTECRKMLDYLKTKKTIADYVEGEEFSKRSSQVKALIRKYPQLEHNKNLNRNNQGITLVIL